MISRLIANSFRIFPSLLKPLNDGALSLPQVGSVRYKRPANIMMFNLRKERPRNATFIKNRNAGTHLTRRTRIKLGIYQPTKLQKRGIPNDYFGRPEGKDAKGHRYSSLWIRPKSAGFSRYFTKWFPIVGRKFEKIRKAGVPQDMLRRKKLSLPPRDFRIGHIRRITRNVRKKMLLKLARRYRISEKDDWPSLWPVARTYNPDVVPLPVRMGYTRPYLGLPPEGHGNLELIKVPNFLHLAPVAVKRQCEVVKQFFTPFPVFGKSDLAKYWPVTVSYSDYVHQSSSIRDCRSRTVTYTCKHPMDRLFLNNERQKTKFRQLCGRRYNHNTQTFSVVIDRCYTRQQNLDYGDFLMTALYNESKKFESWEKLKTRSDNIICDFKGSLAEERIFNTLKKLYHIKQNMTSDESWKPSILAPILDKVESEEKLTKEELRKNPVYKEYEKTWFDYRNNPETPETVREYAKSVKKLLGIPEVEEASYGPPVDYYHKAPRKPGDKLSKTRIKKPRVAAPVEM